MDRLEQIKNKVVRENGYKSFNDMMWTESHVSTVEVVLRDVARRYATEMVKHNLERAAENASLIDPSMNIKCKSGHGFVVDKQSITSLEIELI